LTLLLGSVSRPSAAAQATVPAASRSSGYHLRPDDVIEVTVLGLPQLDKTIVVLPDGTITYPRLGTIRATGMTPQELKAYLFDRLNRFYNNPDVTVTVKQFRTDHVMVRGAIKIPGIYDLRRGWTVRELIAAAGDLATPYGPPTPDQMRATLIRKNGQRIPLRLSQLIGEAGAPDLPLLEPDDELWVEDLTIQVWVEGQVASPKLVALPPGATALEALKQAGGQTDKAALAEAYIRRGTEKIPINLRSYLSGASGVSPLSPLQRYDTLVIPENKNRILIMGGVQRPGQYPVPDDEPLHLTDALGLAGGPVAHAKLDRVSLVQKVNGKPVHTPVDVRKMLKGGDLSRNALIRSGDIIYVPDPKQPGFNPLTILQYAPFLFGL
jgi:polysaccharide biosynthesis/export protein